MLVLHLPPQPSDADNYHRSRCSSLNAPTAIYLASFFLTHTGKHIHVGVHGNFIDAVSIFHRASVRGLREKQAPCWSCRNFELVSFWRNFRMSPGHRVVVLFPLKCGCDFRSCWAFTICWNLTETSSASRRLQVVLAPCIAEHPKSTCMPYAHIE